MFDPTNRPLTPRTMGGPGDIGSLNSGRVYDLLGRGTMMRVGPRVMFGDRVIEDAIGRPVGRVDLLGYVRPI